MNKVSVLLSITLLSCSSLLWAEESPLVVSLSDKSLAWGPCPDFIPKGCEISVLQGDPAQNNVDIFFKVPGGFEIPVHYHTSRERMVLVSGTLDVTYENHDKVTVRVGEFAYGPAELPHSAFCHEGDDCVLYIGFVEPLDAIPVQKAQPTD